MRPLKHSKNAKLQRQRHEAMPGSVLAASAQELGAVTETVKHRAAMIEEIPVLVVACRHGKRMRTAPRLPMTVLEEAANIRALIALVPAVPRRGAKAALVAVHEKSRRKTSSPWQPW